MATQEILVNYKADVEQLTQQLNKVATAQDKVSDSASQTSKDVKQATITQEQAAKKRLELLKKEEAELKRLQAARKLAYDPKVIAEFDRKIAASQQKIGLLGRQSTQALSGVAGSIKSIGASIALGIGAAFSVDAIINFSKASVNAFLEAQKNAERLKFAITQVGGESEAVFDKLLEQSKELQEITIFSDDSIQSAQAALSAFGLTGAEIEKLIPKLADFATVTQKSLEEAAQSVGQGLQGMGREFKKYNIAVSATASEQENLNSILNGFSQFAGAAENATKTLAGQLAQATNQADELQEEIGEKLAPAFVKARVAALEFAKEAVDFFLNTDEAMRKLLKTMGLLPAELAKTSDGFKSFTQEVLAQVDAANALGEIEKVALKLRNDQTEAIAKQQAVIDRLNEAKEDALAREVVNLEEVRAIEEAIRKQQTTNLQNEVTKLNIIEDILKKQRDVKKEEKEQSDARVAGSAKEVELLKLLGAEYNALFKLLKDEQKTKLIELSVTAVTDPEAFKAEVAKLAVEVSNEVVIPIKLEPRLDTTEFNDGINAVEANTVATFLENNSLIISETQELLSSLLGLYSQYNDQKISEIDRETDATLRALDEQEDAVDKNLKNRRVSEREAQKEKENIERERIKVEEDAQRKIRAIKRREFNLNKIAALAEIAIETAKKVTEAPIPLKPYYAGFGLAQAAIVTAQANPYKKGSKDTGSKEHLALVGEEGPELMMMQPHSKILDAGRTKTFGEAIEAMRKNQFDTYVKEKYVTPALVAQQKQHEQTKSKSFADNLSSSIVNNYTSPSGRGDYLLEKISKGIPVSNISEIADALKSNRSYKR